MIKSIVALTLLLGALVWADLWLTNASGETRRASSKVRRLIPPDQRENKLFEAFRLEGGGRPQPLVYGRAKDETFWRCPTYRMAIVSEPLLEAVTNKLFNSEGVVHSDDPAKAATYGFDSPAMVRLAIYGRKGDKAEGDKLFSFDVGSVIPSMNGCYVRVTGSNEILSIDQNLRDELAPAEQTPLPPLVDRTLVPSAWPGAKKGIKVIQVAPPGAPAYELEGRRREVTPEEMKTGKSPWQWFVKQDGQEQAANDQLGMSYAAFLQRAPRGDVADPKLESQAGFSAPKARVALVPNEGDPLVITIGSGQIGTGVPVINGFSKTIDLAAPVVAQLLTPRAEQLLSAGPNPWEPFLKQQSR